jgi:hypothetical protein
MMPLPTKYVAIDEEGFPLFNELRIQDAEVGGELLRNIKFSENGAVQTSLAGDDYLVEAFDEPYVAQSVEKEKAQDKWRIVLPYGEKVAFSIPTLSLDEWDRFHGISDKKVPFVFSRKAQVQFFDELEDYDDTGIVTDGQRYEIPEWLTSQHPVHAETYWSEIYRTELPMPGWDMNQPAPALVEMLPRLKLPPSRVLVLGCGSGNDAAHFAKLGHFVTAVDISPEAIQRAKGKYGNERNLTFIQQDIFQLPSEMHGQFDLIFEHTCYALLIPHGVTIWSIFGKDFWFPKATFWRCSLQWKSAAHHLSAAVNGKYVNV